MHAKKNGSYKPPSILKYILLVSVKKAFVTRDIKLLHLKEISTLELLIKISGKTMTAYIYIYISATTASCINLNK